MNMIKKISCRVVGSVPLGRSSSIIPRVSRSNDERLKPGDAVAANVSSPGNSVLYTGRLGITKEFVGDSLTGQILDCYV
jgi:hypothetical protein